MWRYIRYLLLKSNQNLDLKIERLGKEYFQLVIPSKAISINFMIPKNIKAKDKSHDLVVAIVNSLKAEIKDRLFHNKKIKPKKKFLTNK